MMGNQNKQVNQDLADLSRATRLGHPLHLLGDKREDANNLLLANMLHIISYIKVYPCEFVVDSFCHLVQVMYLSLVIYSRCADFSMSNKQPERVIANYFRCK